MKPAVRIRRVADETVFDVHYGRRRVTWPTWQIAMAHANRLADYTRDGYPVLFPERRPSIAPRRRHDRP